MMDNEKKIGSDGLLKLVQVSGSDEFICRVARSTSGSGGIKLPQDDRALIRYLMRNAHTTPIEFAEAVFFVRVPMDTWRQWIRHRTASVNEYSTRYRTAIDEMSGLDPDEWRLQSKANRQGSAGSVATEWPADWKTTEVRRSGSQTPVIFQCNSKGEPLFEAGALTPGEYLTSRQGEVQKCAREVYEERLELGVAFEVARKDLPLATYTEAYWKCDLNNIFRFLSLRTHSHAQKEIRDYADAMCEMLRPHFPFCFEAFDDFDMRRGGVLLSRLEVEMMRKMLEQLIPDPTHPDWSSMLQSCEPAQWADFEQWQRDQGRKTIRVGERDEAHEKFRRLGLLPPLSPETKS